MKKSWLIILAAVVVFVGIGVTAVLAGKKDADKKGSNSATTQGEHSGLLGKKDACDYFTQATADALLGAGSQKGSMNADASSGDVSVTTCTYTSKADTLEEVRNMKAASVLLRVPLTETGAQSNETPFESRPEGAQDVSGYGDKAYWDPSMGQLNVLKDNTWLVITNGKSRVGDRTLGEAKKLADIVLAAYSNN